MRLWPLGVLALVFSLPCSLGSQGEIREEHSLLVNGVAEVWRLEWTAEHDLFCVDDYEFGTCPCAGFAFGEAGKADLVRLREGREVERLPLGRYFENGVVKLQRWPLLESDIKQVFDLQLGEKVRKRDVVKLMALADFNHDGQATEFFLQTGTEPCGKRIGVVFGVSKDNSRLHVFASAAHPDKPLVLQKREWETLRDATGPVTIVDWQCGDHDARTQTEYVLQAGPKGIAATKLVYACTNDFHRADLLSSGPLR